MGTTGVCQRFPFRHGLPYAQTPILHASRPRAPRVLKLVRLALSGNRTGHGWTAPASLQRLPGGTREGPSAYRAVRVVPGGFPLRYAPPWRRRYRPGQLAHAAYRSDPYPHDHAVPTLPDTVYPVTSA